MGEPGKVTEGAGALYVVNKDLSSRKAVPGVTIPNGLAGVRGCVVLILFGERAVFVEGPGVRGSAPAPADVLPSRPFRIYPSVLQM